MDKFRIQTLNEIAVVGLDRLPRERYEVASNLAEPHAIPFLYLHARPYAVRVGADQRDAADRGALVDDLLRSACKGQIKSFFDAKLAHSGSRHDQVYRNSSQPEPAYRMDRQRCFDGARHALTVVHADTDGGPGLERQQHQARGNQRREER